LSKKKAKFHINNDENNEILHRQRIGKIYGADIDDEVVKINIKTDSFQKTIELNKSSKPYSIVIRYKCCNEHPTTITDFQNFYDALNFPANHAKTDITYEAPENPYFHCCETKLMQRFKESSEFKKELETNNSVSLLINYMILAREACEGATVPNCPLNLEGIPEPCET
jgi:hypothetical protein